MRIETLEGSSPDRSSSPLHPLRERYAN